MRESDLLCPPGRTAPAYPPRLPATRPRHAARRRAASPRCAPRVAAEAVNKPAAKAKACILIWMDGGPTHYETFDPKPDAPAEIRGEFKADPDRRAGRPVLRAHDASSRRASTSSPIVRSIRHDQGNHGAGNHYMMTGAPPRIPVGCGAFVSFHPSLGSVVAAREAAAGRAAGVLLDAEHVALRRAELPRREVRPVRRRRTTRTAPASASATWPCPTG